MVISGRRPLLGAIVAVLGAYGSAAAPSSAQVPTRGAWEGPSVAASERGVQFSSVGAALTDERGLVIWASRRPEFRISGVELDRSGAPGPPFAISPSTDRASAPLVGMAASGEAVVAWRAGRPRALRVVACIRPGAGGSCGVQRLSAPGRLAVLQDLAVHASGYAVASWIEVTPAGSRAVVAERTPGGRFGAARRVGPPGALASQVAVGPASVALALNRPRRGPCSEVRLVTWARGGRPGSSHAASRCASPAPPRLAIADDESAVLTWHRAGRRGASAGVEGRRRDCARSCPADGGGLARFGPTASLTSAARGETSGLTAAAAGSRVVVAWIGWERRGPSQARAVQWDGEGREPERVVSDPRYSVFDVALAVSRARTILAYREYGRPGVRDGLVVARTSGADALVPSPDAGLSDPRLILQSASRLQPAVSPDGAGLIAFTAYGRDGSGRGEVSFARLPAGPGGRMPQ